MHLIQLLSVTPLLKYISLSDVFNDLATRFQEIFIFNSLST